MACFKIEWSFDTFPQVEYVTGINLTTRIAEIVNDDRCKLDQVRHTYGDDLPLTQFKHEDRIDNSYRNPA